MTATMIARQPSKPLNSSADIVIRDRIRVMQLTDSLSLGGTERVAVNLANTLPRYCYKSYLCTTRCGGPLSDLIASDIERIDLARTQRFDMRAIRRLVDFIRVHRIQILHAHSSSLLVANIASRFSPYPKIIWHDHFGRFEVERRPRWLFRALTHRVAGVITVSQPLADWSRQALRVKTDRVWYLPNFPTADAGTDEPIEMPGLPGKRIVCVANLRPEKDHLTLIDAMRGVIDRQPDAHLFLLGSLSNESQVSSVRQRINQHQLFNHVHILGSRKDVSTLIRKCDVGVLSSVSEGLPLSLLEYGLAGLPAIATDVGQCREVLDDGRCGSVVPCGSASQLTDAIVEFLHDPSRSQSIGRAFQQRIRENYSDEAALKQLDAIYNQVLFSGKSASSNKS